MLEAQPGLTLKPADATSVDRLAPALHDHDVVISASNFVSSHVRTLIAAVKQAGVRRLMVVGGAGTLEVAPGVILMDTPEFPETYKAKAMAGRAFLDVLRRKQNLDWVFLSPPAEFEPGERTGKFRLGGDQLLVDADGRSWISMEDYAVAFADELETPRHSRQRFAVSC
jgi:hypothetical protein